jgi:hypothetical protein
MSQPFYTAVVQEKEDVTRDSLKEHYPRLPSKVIDRAIETVSWHTLFGGTNRYNTQAALDNFSKMAIDIVEEQKEKNVEVIEMILLDHDKRLDERVREDDTELVKGIRSIPTGVLLIILKSTHSLWTTS